MNNPPFIDSGSIPDQIVSVDKIQTLKLSKVQDREGQAITFKAHED